MSQSARHRATAASRVLWRLAGDVACLLLHGSLHRPPSGEDRSRFDRRCAEIFLGSPFDADDLGVRLDRCASRRGLPRLAEVQLALLAHPRGRLVQREPSPQMRAKLREARPALHDATRVDRPAHWIVDVFTSRAAEVLGAGHPLVKAHEERVKANVLTPLRTANGPVPSMRERQGPHRDGRQNFFRHGWPPAFALESRARLLPFLPPSLWDLAGPRGGLTPTSSPTEWLRAHPGVETFETHIDHAAHLLTVIYRGTVPADELEEMLSWVVPAGVAVRVARVIDPSVASFSVG